jgi:Muskelin N-terminus
MAAISEIPINQISTSPPELTEGRAGTGNTNIPTNKIVDYSIESCSSHSASYSPQHIKVSKPQDQSSRFLFISS